MVNSSIPHDALIQATFAYRLPPEERTAMLAAIDTSMHPALPLLIEALHASKEKDHEGVRKAMDAAFSLVSSDANPELYLILVINDARFLAVERSPKAGMQRLVAEEHRFDAASPIVRMAARCRLGVLCLNSGQLSEAFNSLSAARTIAKAESWEYDDALIAFELGNVYLETGDPVKAIAHYEEAYEALSRMGDANYTEIMLMNLALAHGRVGETSTAERLMEDALSRFRNHKEFDKYVSALLNMASVKKGLGKLDEAKAIYEEVLSGTANKPVSIEQVRAWIGTASISNDHGDRLEALEQLDRAKALAIELGQTVMALNIDMKRADVLRDHGSKEEACVLLRTTFGELRKQTHTLFTILAGNQLEQWLVEDGYPAEAYEVLKVCTNLQREVYKKESERALELSSVRQNIEAERRNMSLREEERRSLLQQVLPLPIADRIMAGETRIAEQIDMVGILFADIVGFTQFSAGKTPRDVLDLLEDLFHAVDQIVLSHGCEKIKSIGDSYMATTSTSVEHMKADPTQAIISLARCGLDVLDLLQQTPHAHIQLRIGMHAGPVVAGVMGGMRLAYDMWGDTVNVASRMESTSVPGRLQTTRIVADLLRPLADFRIIPRDAIDVKGRGAMDTFWVERAG